MCAWLGDVSKRVASAQLVLFVAEAEESDWQLLNELTLHAGMAQGPFKCLDLVGGHLGPVWESHLSLEG